MLERKAIYCKYMDKQFTIYIGKYNKETGKSRKKNLVIFYFSVLNGIIGIKQF